MNGYTAFTAYCAAVGYDPYLHDDNPNCIPDNLDVFSLPAVPHSAMPFPPHPNLTPEVENLPYEGGGQDSEVAKDVIRNPDSEGDTFLFYFSFDGPVQDSLETTTLLISEKLKEDTTK